MRGFEKLAEVISTEHSSFGQPGNLFGLGCSKQGSPLHIMQQMLYMEKAGGTNDTKSSDRIPQLSRNLRNYHRLSRRQRFWNVIREEGNVLKRPHYIIITRKWEAIYLVYWWILPSCGKASEMESSCIEFLQQVTNCWRRRWMESLAEVKAIQLSLADLRRKIEIFSLCIKGFVSLCSPLLQ